MVFALKLPILVGECGGCGIRIDLAVLGPYFWPFWGLDFGPFGALILAVFGP